MTLSKTRYPWYLICMFSANFSTIWRRFWQLVDLRTKINQLRRSTGSLVTWNTQNEKMCIIQTSNLVFYLWITKVSFTWKLTFWKRLGVGLFKKILFLSVGQKTSKYKPVDLHWNVYFRSTGCSMWGSLI